NGRLTLAYRDLTNIPPEVAEKFAARTQELDLSYNRFSNLSSLEAFTNIHTLILDSNAIKSSVKFPHLPKLTTLWLNKNSIVYLTVFIDRVTEAFPKLKFLSLMNNVVAPSYLNGGTQTEYMEYRHYVISQLTELTMLDDKHVSKEERVEAQRLYVGSTPTNNEDTDGGNEFEDSNVFVNKSNDKKEIEMSSIVNNTTEIQFPSSKNATSEATQGASVMVASCKETDESDKLPQASAAKHETGDTKPNTLSAKDKFKKAGRIQFDAARLYSQHVKLIEMQTRVQTAWRGQDDFSESDTDDVDNVEKDHQNQHQEEEHVIFGDLTEAQSQEIKWTFQTFRYKDSKNAILTKNLPKLMRKIGWNLTEKEYTEMQAEMDPEATGTIEYKDFQNVLSRGMVMDVDCDVMNAFQLLDQDGDGTITCTEFRHIMRTAINDLPENELQEMIEDMDLDGDGQIDYEEFAGLVKVSRKFVPSGIDATVTSDDWFVNDMDNIE
ncbi:uncharacterized protein, partial [Amphiura filiformis]|uniref:uncharacterized protein n=1 Tax=Amphiura filiformis TaxID=82378 RepID=UPI003B212039